MGRCCMLVFAWPAGRGLPLGLHCKRASVMYASAPLARELKSDGTPLTPRDGTVPLPA